MKKKLALIAFLAISTQGYSRTLISDTYYGSRRAQPNDNWVALCIAAPVTFAIVLWGIHLKAKANGSIVATKSF
jgi:hypothetical protein